MEIESLPDLICNLKENMADTYCKITDMRDELTKYAKSVHSHAISDITNLNSILSNKADKATATTSTNGLMSKEDKVKLEGLSNYEHPKSGVTAGTNYADNQTPGFGASFNIPKITYNAQGHITNSVNAKVTLPSLGTTDTTAAKGNHTHSQYLTQHQSLTNYVQKSSTTGLIKNDGTIDTKTYLTQHQTIPTGSTSTAGIVKLSNETNSNSTSTAATSKAVSDISTLLNNKISKSNTSGLVKNDGTIDTKTYLTQHQTIPTGSTSTAGIVQLSNALDSTSVSTAATSKAINDTYTSLNNNINGNAASYSILVSNTTGATFDTKVFNMPISTSNQRLYASVKKNNQILTVGVVLFVVNGIVYPKQIHYTDSSYFAILNINLPVGTYDVFIHYVGNGRYNSNDPKIGNVIAGSYDYYTYCMDYCKIIRQ